MQMIQAMTTSVPGTVATAAGNGGASADTAGFSKLLVQVMGGASAGSAPSGTLPDLAQLLAGLLAILPAGEAEQLSEGSAGNQAAWNDLMNRMADQPELLEKLLNGEEMQEWMLQAASLLQAMQLLPEHEMSGPSLSAGDDGEPNGGVHTAAVSTMEAQGILKALARASSDQEGNVFVEQMQEKLGALLSRLNLFSDMIARTGIVNGTEQTKGESVAEHVIPSAGPRLNENVSRKEAKGRGEGQAVPSADLAGKVQWTSGTPAVNRLEMLAARSMPVGRIDLMMPQQEQAAVEAALLDGGAEETAHPSSFAQELNRLIPQKAELPADAVVRSSALVEDMTEFMLGKLRLHNANGITEARMILTPEALGQVEVKLTMHNGQLVAQFAAHTAAGKDMLEAQLSQLRSALVNQGIQVDKLEVTQSPSLQSGMFQDQRQQQQFQQQNGQNPSGRNSEGQEEYTSEAVKILNGHKENISDGFDVTA